MSQTAEIRLLKEITRHPAALTISLLTGLLSTAGSLAVPLITRQVIADVSAGRSVNWLVIGAFAIALASAAAQGGSAYLLARIGSHMVYRIRVAVMSHILRLPVQHIKAEGAGALTSRITSDALMLRQVIDVGLAQMPASALLVAASIAAMAWLNWLLTLVSAGVFALVGIAIVFMFKWIKANAIEQQTALGSIAGRFSSHLDAITTIKASSAEDTVEEDLSREADRVRRIGLTGDVLQAAILPVLAGGQQVALLAIILVGSVQMSHGTLSVASFSAFVLYLLQLAAPVMLLFTGFGRLRIGQAVKDRFNVLLATPREQDGRQPATRLPETRDNTGIVFDKVSYGYPGTEQQAITDLSFFVPRHGLTTLVGPSGAGKSTVLSLIERFATAQQGHIYILGTDIHAWSLHDLRRNITYVDQAFTLLQASVRQNLSVQRKEPIADAELWDALGSVGLTAAVAALPEQLDTVIGAETDLSGGQRQRLALARALLSDTELVILDEPTSQLDGINEDRFRSIIEDLARTRAVLVVAHRLSTVRSARHVIMLDEGGLVKEGPHDVLLENCEPYRELHAAQTLT
ncbi:ABC transporter ATP-binding protein [Streptomyces sp. NBC_00078]|uniref:ABC transporter ATP-binding protein n=1 Tax=unclassified Streptomyces TaxID=2593676 RepID=UPI0022578632|nr:ABC transporter ATP-binding protein [Streptomyces sp. NBC_00078]MCX5421900.1 ABC transporter ATP-binding protein/permease [Streptomyces sp. NBC_00078]